MRSASQQQYVLLWYAKSNRHLAFVCQVGAYLLAGMWPFSSKRERLTEEQQQKIRKKCKSLLSAYSTCAKVYRNDPSKCERLETRLVECYATQCPSCQAQVEDFQDCLLGTGSIVGGIVGNECSKQVEDMRKCLAKLHLYPIK